MKLAMKYLVALLVALVSELLVPATAMAQPQHCPYEQTCTRCMGIGRSYVMVGGLYCTVCNGFCPIILLPIAPPGGGAPTDASTLRALEQQVADKQPKSERLFVQVSDSIVRTVANVNPDVAVQLYALSVFSAQGAPAMPMSGDGGAKGMFSPAALDALLMDKTLSAPLDAYMLPVPIGGATSQTRYAVTKTKGSAYMLMSHRLIDDRNVEVGSPYPDIKLDLQWIATGAAGYWQVISWQAVSR